MSIRRAESCRISVSASQKRDGKLVNVDIGQVDMVKDPWKIDNPPKSN